MSQALTHAAKAVQVVGMNTLREIAEDPLLSGRTLPTRLQSAGAAHGAGMAGRRRVIHRRVRTTNPKKARKPCFGMRAPSSESEAGPETRAGRLSSDSEGGPYST